VEDTVVGKPNINTVFFQMFFAAKGHLNLQLQRQYVAPIEAYFITAHFWLGWQFKNAKTLP
jgi:hypothetical protein